MKAVVTKLCIIIGEGDSERRFLPPLIVKEAQFCALADKDPWIYQKGDVFWFFPFPPAKIHGGKSRLSEKVTYRTANNIVENSKSTVYPKCTAEIHYIILADLDGCDSKSRKKKIESITSAFKDSGVSHASFKVLIVEKVIECWYFAGLREDFPHFQKNKLEEVKKHLRNDPEKIHEPKKTLHSLLKEEHRGAIKVANIVGTNFDLAKAVEKSKSFKCFWEEVKSKGLISEA